MLVSAYTIVSNFNKQGKSWGSPSEGLEFHFSNILITIPMICSRSAVKSTSPGGMTDVVALAASRGS